MMHMSGFFPSVPTQIRFELLYAPVQGQWKLFGLSVSLGSSAPVAPSDAPAPSAAEQPKGGTGLRPSGPKALTAFGKAPPRRRDGSPLPAFR